MKASQSQPSDAPKSAVTTSEISAAFTPGPWKYETEDGWGTIFARGRRVARVSGDGAEAEASANALLIAASPDLLAAAKGWIDYLDDENEGTAVSESSLLSAIRAAIAKATGAGR